MTLQGKTAIVTGANRGIGRAIARALGGEGASCVLCARDQQRLTSVEREIEESGGSACTLRSTCERLSSGATRRFASRGRPVDIVINNAGATRRGDFLELSDEDFLDGFALKYFGAVRLLRAAWPSLSKSGGSVVNIAGIGGRTPGASFAIGGSVNAALLSLTKSLPPLGSAGIQVNAVNPGPSEPHASRSGSPHSPPSRNISLAAAERMFIESEQVTRIGEPEDIANLVVFVVSPQGRFLHGALIDADGGATKTI